MFDSASPLTAEDFRVIASAAERPSIALLNKRDLPARIAACDLQASGLRAPVIDFSARTATGVEALRTALLAAIEAAAGGDGADDVAISRVRHREALTHALEALGRARDSTLARMPPEIVAVEMNAAAEALAAITGTIGSEDVLDLIFREFCIGK